MPHKVKILKKAYGRNKANTQKEVRENSRGENRGEEKSTNSKGNEEKLDLFLCAQRCGKENGVG